MSGKLAVVSGGFDPLHPGHLNLFQYAKRLPGVEKLVVVVGSDEWVRSKHGRVVLPQADRVRMVASLRDVDAAERSLSPDGDESWAVSRLFPDVWVVGPDHADVKEMQEFRACQQAGCEIVVAYSLGKDYGSSDLIGPPKPRWVNPPVTVSLVVKDSTGAVLFCERLDGTLDFPGGFLEPGESLEECCVRETLEETGVNIDQSYLQYLTSTKDKYPDGRDIVSVHFLLKCGCGVRDALRVGPEHKSHMWVKGVPERRFFSSSDYGAVRRAIGLMA